MKIKVALDDETIICDLSEHPKEVSDYVFDQINDRLVEKGFKSHTFNIGFNYEEQTLTFSEPLIGLLINIMEEKEADMEWEIKHKQR